MCACVCNIYVIKYIYSLTLKNICMYNAYVINIYTQTHTHVCGYIYTVEHG